MPHRRFFQYWEVVKIDNGPVLAARLFLARLLNGSYFCSGGLNLNFGVFILCLCLFLIEFFQCHSNLIDRFIGKLSARCAGCLRVVHSPCLEHDWSLGYFDRNRLFSLLFFWFSWRPFTFRPNLVKDLCGAILAALTGALFDLRSSFIALTRLATLLHLFWSRCVAFWLLLSLLRGLIRFVQG